jgi:haloacetate dehalogenase
VLDIVPTYTLMHNVNNEIATAFYHWFFLVQPCPFPETLIGDNVEFCLKSMMFRDMSSGKIPSWMGEKAFAQYLLCFRDPPAIHATCEDYQAGASIDIKHDEVHRLFEVLAVWRERAAKVSGKPLRGGTSCRKKYRTRH